MSYDDYVIYKPSPPCTCDLCLYAAEFIARRAVVAAANARPAVLADLTTIPATCPNCGAPMQGGTYAQDAPTLPPPTYDASGDRGVVPVAPDANIANEPTPSGYMSRPKML